MMVRCWRWRPTQRTTQTAFVDGLSQEQWESLGTVSAFQNFAVQGLYAPASTFKTVPYVLALEENYYPLDRGLTKEITDAETETTTNEEGAVEEQPAGCANAAADGHRRVQLFR